jgi:hypothetical protein
MTWVPGRSQVHPGIDCAETPALLALLAGIDIRAYRELRCLGPRQRATAARAARRFVEMCENPESFRPSWEHDPAAQT